MSDGDEEGRRPFVSTIGTLGLNTKRMRYPGGDLTRLPPIATQAAYSVIIQLKPFERHRLWRNGVLIFDGGHAAGALAITDLTETWQCHHLSPFDNLRFLIPFDRMRQLAGELEHVHFTRGHSRKK
ncbi:hypothetical protein NAC44_12110 [Allorhizobium sp. BGMRC 0089]|uniref:hypothetical protein n=1 Tax=Allorhizobium sonneratiae TaxID=2934936 RepID=UPI0020340B92|nr:hypothetical protein [Allorhizobium sonneratiae]MCM2293066.1 hypothetical protein [Allorhizobium sonneratiae]